VPPIEPLTIEEIRAAGERIGGTVIHSPLVRLWLDHPAEIYLKLENLQPIGSFKLRGATNAIRLLSHEQLAHGVYTASAGNMAQGVAWSARELGVPCTVVMPDSAPLTKVQAVTRLGARIIALPYDEWWNVLATRGREGIEGTFVHPVADRAVIAGNGTIGLEIIEDMPDVSAVLVPFGGGGLVSGVATAVRALAPNARVYGCEVETSTPLTAAFGADEPVLVERTPSFVDGIGGRGVLPDMWPMVRELVHGALVASLDEVRAAVRLLVERVRVVAEGAGAASVASAVAGRAGSHGKIVCVVSGGNIDPTVLAEILGG
jgi:threonine dehydratase